MRITLEHLDTRGLSLELSPDEHVRIRAVAGLRGTVDQGETVRVEGLAAARVELDALHLLFGTVRLSAGRDAGLSDVILAYDRSAGRTTLDLRSAAVSVAGLSVVAGDVTVEGDVTMTDVHVWQHGDDGGLAASRVVFEQVRLELPGAKMVARDVVFLDAALTWGAAGVSLVAGMIDVGTAELTLAFGDKREASEARASVPFDLRTLDAISGQVDADLTVDLTVPVLGHRVATHRFRIPIAEGALDYLSLENDLAALENQLLDFAVRDGALVLERGIPLLPTRGRGKPIVVWDLSPDDLALAEQRRVRLAVLPSARLASDLDTEPSTEPARPPSVALRRLDVVVEARLALAADDVDRTGPVRLRSASAVVVAGEVHHDAAGPPREGALRVEITALEGALEALPAGSQRIDASRVHVAHVTEADIGFSGVRPSFARVVLKGSSLAGFALRPR